MSEHDSVGKMSDKKSPVFTQMAASTAIKGNEDMFERNVVKV